MVDVIAWLGELLSSDRCSKESFENFAFEKFLNCCDFHRKINRRTERFAADANQQNHKRGKHGRCSI